MIIDEPYNSWLVKNVGENLDANTRFVVKVTAVTAAGTMPVNVDFDLAWFVLLRSQDDPQVKLEVVLALLKQKDYLEQFKATFLIPNAKRMLAEFLLFNPVIMEGLKGYIDFNLLNMPIDFISHALFIKRSFDPDTIDIEHERIQTINMVLDTGFKLTGEVSPKSQGVAIHKILTMKLDDQKFSLVRRILAVGFQLFSDNMANNNEVATILIDNRTNPDALEIIKNNVESFKIITFKVAGTTGSNIADFYYWLREDMPAVEFIKATLNIEISP